MIKAIIINLLVPLVNIVFYLLVYKKVLSSVVKDWLLDYGIFFLIIQILILILTFIVWKKTKYRFIAIAIFIFYVALGLFGGYILPPIYEFD
jgi:hypothetical protein